ncbi:MAG: DNA mismatch repair protein MutS [Candidatus Dormibacteraeota bacterium]|nr:DNA mismatch repair protein MutS [Candidatus Dormibacteraeota bacterium]
MKVHLMGPEEDFDPGSALPLNHQELTEDLDLATLWEAMAQGDKFLLEVARVAVLASLPDLVTIRHRQQVLGDLMAHPEVAAEVYAIAVAAVEGERRIWGFIRATPSGLLHRAIEVLGLFLGLLKRLREIADGPGADFESPGLATFFQMLSRELDDGFFAAADQHLRRLGAPEKMLISARLGEGNRGIDYVLRASGSSRQGWRERIGIGERSAYSFSIPARDEAGARALSELTDRGINQVANALTQSTDHILSFFTQLRLELGFYVGCLNLHARLQEQGQPVVIPTVASGGPAGALSYSGLYDPCLALRLEPGQVVGNDGAADGKSLVLITGANSGGKSTFLRSIGLAQLMLQAGMFVAARAFRGDLATALFTHFLREEDQTMTGGRLDEDLRRMGEIADQVRPRSLILFNESFSATNEREGSEIARQIVKALLEADIRIFFVTHFYDLADSLLEAGRVDVLALRAERRADGQRSFKIKPGDPLPTAYGEDLYRRIFVAGRDQLPADPGAGSQ